MRAGLTACLSPTMRQQFIKAAHGMFGDAAEHISEPDKRVGFRKFAGRNEAAQHSRGLAAVVAAEEGPVIAAHRETPQRPLRRFVVDLQLAVGATPSQRRPLLPSVGTTL